VLNFRCGSSSDRSATPARGGCVVVRCFLYPRCVAIVWRWCGASAVVGVWSLCGGGTVLHLSPVCVRCVVVRCVNCCRYQHRGIPHEHDICNNKNRMARVLSSLFAVGFIGL
jgi:hypothetical protein